MANGPPTLVELTHAAWRLDDRPREMALLVLDMQKEYDPYVTHIIPKCLELIDAFRAAGQLCVWTNWDHRFDDGWYSSIDHLVGAGGVADASNPQFVWTPGGADTISALAPRTDAEKAREIMSLHANKFADRDADGEPILLPMLREANVDTVVIVGAWTDYCAAATALAASDSWGFDVVVVTDAVASANVISDDVSHSGLDITSLFARSTDSQEVLDAVREKAYKSQEKATGARLGLGSF